MCYIRRTRDVMYQGSSLPTQNVYQCRLQEEKAVAALRSAGQSEKDVGAAVNGNQTGPAPSNSMTSFHSQVRTDVCIVFRNPFTQNNTAHIIYTL